MALVFQAIAMPALAQDMEAEPRLEDLIPDEAVADPESWAAEGIPAGAAASEQQMSPAVEADTPLANVPLVTIPWPEDITLDETEELAPEEPPVEFATFEDVIPQIPDGSEEKVSKELVLVFPSDRSLFPEREEFLDRFKNLSTIEQLRDGKNSARLEAQARSDERLLDQLLRVYGYYDAQVIRSVSNVAPGTDVELERPAARFDIIPGKRYSFGAIDLGPLDGEGHPYEDYASLRTAFGLHTGDPVQQDDILGAQVNLDSALGESGYPFAAIEDPQLLVDHDRSEADLTMVARPAGQYRFGRITGNMPEFMQDKHLQHIASFDPGDTYKRSQEQDLRRAILATGLVGSVTVTPVETRAPTAEEPGEVDIAVEMTDAPLRTIRGNVGYGSEEGIRLEASWEHRNLFPPEGSLRVRAVAGTQEQLIGVTFRKNNFKGRDRVLTLDTFATTIDSDAYDARTISFVGRYERLSTLLLQKPVSWGTGIELVYTEEAEAKVKGAKSPRLDYQIAALPSFVLYDSSDDLLDPTEGFRARAAVSPELSHVFQTDAAYLKVQFDLAKYQQVTDDVVLAARARAGSIVGAEIFKIAPSRRFYAGGGGSVRGFGYQAIGPTNALGQPNGGRSLVEASVEARIRTGLMDGALSLVPFADMGAVDRSSTPSFKDMRFGAGLGARYNTGFGPLRLDVAFPINPGPNDSWIAVYVALGQAF